MDYKVLEQDGISTTIQVKNMNMIQIIESGQCFRWGQLKQGLFAGVVGNKTLFVEQTKDRIRFYCSIDEFNSIWVNYFDLNRDYSKIHSLATGDKFLEDAIQYGRGIRILRQEFWEVVVSFIISQQNNIPKIKSTIDKLCRVYGNKIGTESGIDFYTFPTPGALALTTIEQLNQLGLGYRSSYVIAAAREIISTGPTILEGLHADYGAKAQQAYDYLVSFRGIGPKVASCILLFGLGHLNSFPVDVWMRRVIDEYYGGEIDISNLFPYAGVLQQYMFYYMRNKLYAKH